VSVRGGLGAYRRGVRVQATVSPKASAMIDELLATGLFGLTRAEFLQRALYDFLQQEKVYRFAPRSLRAQRRRAVEYTVRKFAASAGVDPAVYRARNDPRRRRSRG